MRAAGLLVWPRSVGPEWKDKYALPVFPALIHCSDIVSDTLPGSLYHVCKMYLFCMLFFLSGNLSGICSRILSGKLSGIYADFLSGIYFDILSLTNPGIYSEILSCPFRSGAREVLQCPLTIWSSPLSKEGGGRKEKVTLMKAIDPHLAGGN